MAQININIHTDEDLKEQSETIAAIKEADIISRNPNTKKYSSFKELLTEVQQNV